MIFEFISIECFPDKLIFFGPCLGWQQSTYCGQWSQYGCGTTVALYSGRGYSFLHCEAYHSISVAGNIHQCPGARLDSLIHQIRFPLQIICPSDAIASLAARPNCALFLLFQWDLLFPLSHAYLSLGHGCFPFYGVYCSQVFCSVSSNAGGLDLHYILHSL